MTARLERNDALWPWVEVLSATWPALPLPFICAEFRLFKFPRRFLAQIDSSVGGKTGVNLPQRKKSGRQLFINLGRHHRH